MEGVSGPESNSTSSLVYSSILKMEAVHSRLRGAVQEDSTPSHLQPLSTLEMDGDNYTFTAHWSLFNTGKILSLQIFRFLHIQ
jgi:hypothetical protein